MISNTCSLIKYNQVKYHVRVGATNDILYSAYQNKGNPILEEPYSKLIHFGNLYVTYN